MLHDPENKKLIIETPSRTQKKRENSPGIDKEESVIITQLRSELYAKNKEIQSLKTKLENDNQISFLKKALKQVQDFLAMVPISIYFKNKNLEYTYANQAFAAWANIPLDELIGLNNKQLQIGDYLCELEKIEQQVIEKDKVVQNKEITFTQDKEQLLVNAYIFPMKDIHGNIEGIMVCCFDLSEKVQFRKELINAEEKALLGINSKKTFLANLSHEIRTPLHGILGSGNLLKSMIKDTHALDLLDNINRSGNTLLEMVDSMFLLELLEKGEWSMRKEPFKLRDIIQIVSDKFLDQAKIKMIDIQSFVAQGLPDILLGDVEKIQLILTIFLSNAVKFTNKGFVHLFVQSEHQKDDNIRLKFSIKDTGSGIKKEMQSELFKTFTQGDSSSTKGFQGTGIGLAMAEKTVSYLGGKMGFESAEFKGSTFWFSVDLEKIQTEAEIDGTLTISELPVLLVEDNKINQKIAFFTLKKLGFNVEIAENGLDAVERYQSGSFKIVLMDLQMPIMNGFDATTRIRAFEKHKNLQPSLIIAISANTVKEDIEKCFVVGMNEYISKPFSPEKLIDVIQKHIDIQLH